MSDITPQELRHCASEPRQYRVVEQALLAAAAKIERLTAELKQRNADYGQLVDLVNRAALADKP